MGQAPPNASCQPHLSSFRTTTISSRLVSYSPLPLPLLSSSLLLVDGWPFPPRSLVPLQISDAPPFFFPFSPFSPFSLSRWRPSFFLSFVPSAVPPPLLKTSLKPQEPDHQANKRCSTLKHARLREDFKTRKSFHDFKLKLSPSPQVFQSPLKTSGAQAPQDFNSPQAFKTLQLAASIQDPSSLRSSLQDLKPRSKALPKSSSPLSLQVSARQNLPRR
ncbi:hypothetical protein B0H15DRAFT_637625 [Mycena belliarum]|uniref:Uncharacterized protein n=1 Tax=Mycena belliarum TaxID=1033014 RepID=A0AAD6UIE7_9AGAR|nr:hypothetical protein B0H15DRAFT_637625 [Mycena belliae]